MGHMTQPTVSNIEGSDCIGIRTVSGQFEYGQWNSPAISGQSKVD